MTWKSNINNTLCSSHNISMYKWSEVKYPIWRMLHNILKKDFSKNLKDAGMLYVGSILDRISIIRAKPVFYCTEIMLDFWYGNMDEVIGKKGNIVLYFLYLLLFDEFLVYLKCILFELFIQLINILIENLQTRKYFIEKSYSLELISRRCILFS